MLLTLFKTLIFITTTSLLLLHQPNQTMEQTSPPSKWPTNLAKTVFVELKTQRGIAAPLMIMNLIWFFKLTITTVFLGRLGVVQLAGGALGFTFANVTGFSVLNGLCGAMDPICGQAFGAKNYRLLHKTLFMAILLLVVASIPISFLWINVDKILTRVGQEHDISIVARDYLVFLLPDLLLTAFLSPLKSYLSCQCITLPIMFTSAFALACHFPLTLFLSKSKGLQGISMAFCLTDVILVILLLSYVLVTDAEKWKELGGWWDQSLRDWTKLVKLAAPSCLGTCLEWWCYEILILLAGRLPDAKLSVSVFAVVLNFDCLLYSIMLSLATCASVRVSNELGRNQPGPASKSAYVSLGISMVLGVIGGCVMVSVSGVWGSLFTRNRKILNGVKKTMLLMAVIEVVNFPVAACGGILRGTARPLLAMYPNFTGFYLLALPLGVILAFYVGLGLSGLLVGFLFGMICCLMLLVWFVMRIDWNVEALNALRLAFVEALSEGRIGTSLEIIETTKV